MVTLQAASTDGVPRTPERSDSQIEDMLVSPFASLRSSLNPDYAVVEHDEDLRSSCEIIRETLQDMVRTTKELITCIKSEPSLKRALSGEGTRLLFHHSQRPRLRGC